MIRIILPAALLLAAFGAQASVYRCDARGGAVRYQNTPCPGGTFQQQLPVATPPPPELFRVPPSEEIRRGIPVRVVPLAGEAPRPSKKTYSLAGERR